MLQKSLICINNSCIVLMLYKSMSVVDSSICLKKLCGIHYLMKRIFISIKIDLSHEILDRFPFHSRKDKDDGIQEHQRVFK